MFLRIAAITLVVASACSGDHDLQEGAPEFERPHRTTQTTGLQSPAPGAVAAPPERMLPERADDWVYRISYHSQDQVNRALVVIPKRDMPAGGFPLFVYNHGTVGIADHCAPSDHPESSFTPYLFPTSEMARRYITILPDYDGYHNAIPHQYFSSERAAMSVLDAIRAVKALIPPGNNYGFSVDPNRIVMAGYSQGGHVSLGVLQIQAAYAPELPIALLVALAPGSDALAHLQTMAQHHVASIAAGGTGHPYLGLASLSFYAVERAERPAAEASGERLRFLHSPMHEDLPSLVATRCISELHVPASAFTSDFGRRALANDWDDTPWRAWFSARVAGAFSSETPIVIIGGLADSVVGASETAALYHRLKAHGNRVAHIVSPQGNHASLPVVAESLLAVAVNLGFFQPELSPVAIYDLSGFANRDHTFHYQGN